jgi:hypothetical protein
MLGKQQAYYQVNMNVVLSDLGPAPSILLGVALMLRNLTKDSINQNTCSNGRIMAIQSRYGTQNAQYDTVR